MTQHTARIFSVLVLIVVTGTAVFATPSNADRVPEIQKKVQDLQRQMNQVSEVPKLMDKFEPLMKEKKYKEAEEVVDAGKFQDSCRV